MLSTSSQTKQEYWLAEPRTCNFLLYAFHVLHSLFQYPLYVDPCIWPSLFYKSFRFPLSTDSGKLSLSPKISATSEMHPCWYVEATGFVAIISGSMPEPHRETFPLTHQIHPQEAIPLNSSNCSIHLNDFYSKQLLSQELGECKTNKEPTPHFCDSRGNRHRNFSFY